MIKKKVLELGIKSIFFRVFNIDQNFRNETLQRIKTYFGDKDEKVHNEILDQIQKCLEHIDLLSVYSTESNIELDEAILNSLLKARKYGLKGNRDQSLFRSETLYSVFINLSVSL